MFNKPVIRPCFGGGYIRGGRLTSDNHGAAFIVNMAIFWLEVATWPPNPCSYNLRKDLPDFTKDYRYLKM